jgi:hypothetical protein
MNAAAPAVTFGGVAKAMAIGFGVPGVCGALTYAVTRQIDATALALVVGSTMVGLPSLVAQLRAHRTKAL